MMKTGVPLTPDDIPEAQAKAMSSIYIDAINKAIVKYWNGDSATFGWKDINILAGQNITVAQIRATFPGFKVEYDSPAYCDTYEAAFVFSRHRPKSGVQY